MAEICAREKMEWYDSLFATLCVVPFGVFARDVSQREAEGAQSAREMLSMARKSRSMPLSHCKLFRSVTNNP
jgi:hypothetical protein